MVLTEDDYRQRIEFLEEWNNMPSETTIERAARLAFRQKKRQGYRLNKQYRVHEARNGTKQLKRRYNEEDDTDDTNNNNTNNNNELSVCHTGNIFDVIQSVHLPDHAGAPVLCKRIAKQWYNIPKKVIEMFIEQCPNCGK